MKTLFFTTKQWKRFDWDKQQILTLKYAVILTDYQTNKQKFIHILKKFNFKNFNKCMDVFAKSAQKFGGSVDSMTKEFSEDMHEFNTQAKITEEKNKENIQTIYGNKSIPFWSEKPISFGNNKVSLWGEK
ncbi:MAG: hypothetical protein ACKVN8_07140 [Nitrosarchaeum sp.]